MSMAADPLADCTADQRTEIEEHAKRLWASVEAATPAEFDPPPQWT